MVLKMETRPALTVVAQRAVLVILQDVRPIRIAPGSVYLVNVTAVLKIVNAVILTVRLDRRRHRHMAKATRAKLAFAWLPVGAAVPRAQMDCSMAMKRM